MRQFWTSLRFRVLLLVVFATIPAFALILYSGFQARQQAAKEAQDQALQLARIASTQHQHIIDETHRLLLSVAQVPAIRDGNGAGGPAMGPLSTLAAVTARIDRVRESRAAALVL